MTPVETAVNADAGFMSDGEWAAAVSALEDRTPRWRREIPAVAFLRVALSGLLVLRWLGVSRAVAAVLAVLYAFLPSHFFRGEVHLLLSGYYAVPLGVVLAVMATRGEALFGRRPGVRGPAA